MNSLTFDEMRYRRVYTVSCKISHGRRCQNSKSKKKRNDNALNRLQENRREKKIGRIKRKREREGQREIKEEKERKKERERESSSRLKRALNSSQKKARKWNFISELYVPIYSQGRPSAQCGLTITVNDHLSAEERGRPHRLPSGTPATCIECTRESRQRASVYQQQRRGGGGGGDDVIPVYQPYIQAEVYQASGASYLVAAAPTKPVSCSREPASTCSLAGLRMRPNAPGLIIR